ncbi:MAG: hypothetical protein JWN25_1964 [Verrucomicrobiales bacterium]|nr:hypothetical protein [Verrucomicrobiales bacterium]
MTFRGYHLGLKLFLFLLVCAILSVVYYQHYLILPRVQFLTGWILFLLMVVLAVYNGRKKIPFLPLLSSRGWLRFHLWAGGLTALIFVGHLRLRIPSGWFEWTLASLYGAVMLSGIGGYFISRAFPKRLTSRGGEVIFESIPVVRRRLKEQADAMALKSVPEVNASTLADFYVSEISGYFAQPQNFWMHLFEIRSPLNQILKKIEDQNRFLNEKERGILSEIALLIRQKDGLDYHHSLQLALKLWLFIHIPLTYSLLIFSLLHGVLAYAFSGGAG